MDIITELTEIIKTSKDFVLNEAPDVIYQILLYERIIVSIGLFFVIGILFFVPKIIKSIKSNWDKDDPIGIIITVPFILYIFMTPPLICHSIKIFFAPKVFLLEYLSKLIN